MQQMLLGDIASPEMSGDPRKLARRTDPATSHKAAARVEEFAPSHREQVLSALRRFGRAGAEQIAAATKMDAYSVRKRLSDLEHASLARPTETLRTTASGRKERVWEPVE